MNNNLYYISGYWKDDKSTFDYYLVCEFDGVEEEDDNIFFYGLSMSDAEASKFDENTALEFVITSVYPY